MAYAQPDDLFAVNRNDITYSVKKENLMAEIQDTDYMLINRGDTTYKISGADVLGSFIPELLLNAVLLSTQNPSTFQTIAVTLDASGGEPPYTTTYEWLQKDNNTPEAIIPNQTESTLVVTESLGGFELACRVTITDNRGTTVTKTSDYTAPVTLTPVDPQIQEFTITELNPDSDPRFTDQSFSIKGTMLDQGVPESIKTISVSTKGSIRTNQQFNEQLQSVTIKDNVTYTANNGYGNPFSTSGTIDNFLDGNTGTAFGIFGRTDSTGYFQVSFVEPIPIANSISIRVSSAFGTSSCVGYGPGGALAATAGGNYWYLNGSTLGGFLAGLTFSIYGDREFKFYSIESPTNTGLVINKKQLTLLTFPPSAPVSLLSKGSYLNQGGTASGIVSQGYNGSRSVLLSSQTGTWQTGQNVTGPSGVVTVDNVEKFLEFDQTGNVTDLSDVPMETPWTSQEAGPDSGVDLTLKFPSRFANNEIPDDMLLDNTELTATFTAISDGRIAGPVASTVTPGATTTTTLARSFPQRSTED